jgi:hypothetical protein
MDMPLRERADFRSRSFEIISNWVSSMDPLAQILKII